MGSLLCVSPAAINSSRSFSAGACGGENGLSTHLPAQQPKLWIDAYIFFFPKRSKQEARIKRFLKTLKNHQQ